VVKLRRIAPAVAGVSALGCIVGQASPAAASTHYVGCDGAQLCLWYSSGPDSAIWRTDQSIVWSNFSYDYIDPSSPTWDHFTSGNGSDYAVRNDAHSAENGYRNIDTLFSLPDLRGLSDEFSAGNGLFSLPGGIQNNEASYKSSQCSVNYDGVEIC
jgi:hypothetical protein